ncbi:MAG: hypothetical protein VR70_08285 [Rhodospirillaceae bacterium BRH_c57]|nr:MAG: hypothetical protein VR70_08285 [Rhodospirillaceae bacterium BRH_c57]
MRPLGTFGQSALAALLCLSLVVWSVMPSVNHAPSVIETLQEYAEVIATHGHSHGLEEDLYWALHGHSHDVVDHDHSQALLVLGAGARSVSCGNIWQSQSSSGVAHHIYRIERPPCA